MIKYIKIISILTICISLSPNIALAGPQSTNYELVEYGFGSGGTEATGTESTNYSIFGTAGEVEYGKLDSTSFSTLNGLVWTLQASVSAAPTLTNPSSNYDRLKFTLNSAIGPADTKYAIGISTDDFASDNRYIQSDGTIGNTLGAEDWQTYPEWGGSSGMYVTGLESSTTYYIRVKAEQGNFTESRWSLSSNATTSDPSLTFGLSAYTLTFSNLGASNSYTDNSKITTLTTSTNAYNGYIVYGRVTQPMTSGSNTIANYASPNSSPTTWSGTGFGYTTNDSDLTGGTPDRFTNGGPKYAGFGTSTPGDPVADHLGPVLNAIVDEEFDITYRITADSSTPAGTYTSTVIYVVVPEY